MRTRAAPAARPARRSCPAADTPGENEITFTQLVPLDVSDAERAAIMDDFAAFCSNLRESGKEPVVAVEPTSAGDVFIATVEGQATP